MERENLDWWYSDDFISDNPYQLELQRFNDRMYDMGLVSLENDGSFEYWHIDLSSAPIKMKIEYYHLKVDEILYEMLYTERKSYELSELHYYCNMLVSHTITSIKNKYC